MPQREHSSKHFEQELIHLRERVLAMGARVERMIGGGMRALVQRNEDLAREMIALDNEVDHDEQEIDEICIRLLAQRQPVASDLRFITLCMKVVTDLERMGDLSVNLCERALELMEEPLLKPLIDLPRMGDLAQRMVHSALDCLIEGNVEQAEKVLQSDDAVDQIYEQIFRELISFILEDPKTAKRAIGLLFAAKHLERIGDHATNIAEMVIFWIKGKDVRHGGMAALNNGGTPAGG